MWLNQLGGLKAQKLENPVGIIPESVSLRRRTGSHIVGQEYGQGSLLQASTATLMCGRVLLQLLEDIISIGAHIRTDCHLNLLSDGRATQYGNKTLLPIAGFQRDGTARAELKSVEGKQVVVGRVGLYVVYFMTSVCRPYSVNGKVKKIKLSRNRPCRPIGLWDVKDPTLSRQSAHRWR
jgi:hypothetical protein